MTLKRNNKIINKSFDLIFNKELDKFIIGICRFPSPPQKGFLLNDKSET